MRNFVRSIVLSEPVLAEPLEDANAAYDKEDYVTALRLFRPLAEQGDTRAQFSLGVMYDLGHGVPKDDAQAVKWYRLAADQGHAGAQFSLDKEEYFDQPQPLYVIKHHYAEALKWYRLADQGDTDAQMALGFMYDNGLCVPKDDAQAAKWYRLAAGQGDAVAQFNLGYTLVTREPENPNRQELPTHGANQCDFPGLSREQGIHV